MTVDVVLLTATIVPPADATQLVRHDAGLRLADYLDAFDFYLGELEAGTVDGLVFCDNSAFELEPFAAMAGLPGNAGKVELVSFDGLDHPASYGRGYGEFKLVDHAMATSAVLRAADARTSIWKITGRYKIRNLRELVRTRPPDADLYCNFRNRPLRWMDMYLLAWNRTAYDEVIRGVYEELKEDASEFTAEQRFRSFLDNGCFSSTIVPRFRRIADIDGIRAGDNLNYAGMKRKYYARVAANRLLPWLWI
jgi:hypothetical protein